VWNDIVDVVELVMIDVLEEIRVQRREGRQREGSIEIAVIRIASRNA
jgi:hypothetical protein